MTPTDFCEILRLLDRALAIFRHDRAAVCTEFRRELRAVSREVDLLRARLGQPSAQLQRN
jgi:hypothetical protein